MALAGVATPAPNGKTAAIAAGGFVASHYLIANPDLWELVSESEAEAHFRARGQAQGRPHRLPFVSSFYRELYLFDQPGLSDKQAEQHWIASGGANAGSLHEVLFRAGFKPPNWLNHFKPDAYVAYNFLWKHVHNGTQALVHFITTGINQIFALSAELEFNPAFVRSFPATPANLNDAQLYKHWVEVMLSAYRRNGEYPPNETQLVRHMGLKLSRIPAAFDWRRYFAERPSIDPAYRRDKWSAVEHFINHGVLEAMPLPLPNASAEPLLRAAADRFAEKNDFGKGNAIYDRYLLDTAATAQGIQHAADLAYREHKFARALFLYNRVLAMGQANLWTFLNGAVCAQELGEYDIGQALILDGLRGFPRNVRLQERFMALQSRIFDLAVTRHLSALRDGVPAVSAFPEDVKRIYDSFRTYYDVQFPAGMAHRPSAARGAVNPDNIVIAVLANYDLPQCTFYRITQKLEQMLEIGVEIQFFAPQQMPAFITAASTSDIVMFYRLAATPAMLQCLAYCDMNNIPTVYEIDDLVFEADHFPDEFESYSGTISAEKHFELRSGVALVRSFISLCDFGIASTPALAAALGRVVKTGQVFVHRNLLAMSLVATAKGLGTKRPKKADSVTTTIFYGSGTLAHARDFTEQVQPALMRLMRQFPDVRFVACGHVDVAALEKAFPARVTLVKYIEDRAQYLKLLAKADINIAVLHANQFNDCKSEIKWLEAAAFGIPSVVSDVAVYRDSLTHDEDVLITPPNAEGWYKALRLLATQPKRRAEIGAKARARALQDYEPTKAAARLADALCGFAASRPGAVTVAGAKRILIVNVFFPPQAIGGATRIVAGQVLEMGSQYADRYEVAIFCGNDEDGPRHEMTSYSWNGVKVYSVNTPLREGNDWLYFDPEIKPAFEAVLDRFKPDLVHFHAIQRLTAVMIDVLRSRGVPFVVTVHDAWWISDHQFLVDTNDRVVMPWERPAMDQAANDEEDGPPAAEIRLRALASRLGQANAVLAVSENFASIYRRAGITAARAVVNGLTKLPPLEPLPAPSGKLRLGHFGGLGYMKGFSLLKRALTRSAYNGLELTVVDLSKTHGEVEFETWGATEVKIIGRVPQDGIGWLYGQIDVLIAPSVWPESFGLVVREAVTYGKWVVVSNRGALPEAVLPGVNGFIIDLDDPAALPDVLAMLEADRERFTKAPERWPHITTMAEHTREVCGVYEEILSGKARKRAVRK
jgi:glycosyltransferase involved in cell wall biosynthesis